HSPRGRETLEILQSITVWRVEKLDYKWRKVGDVNYSDIPDSDSPGLTHPSGNYIFIRRDLSNVRAALLLVHEAEHVSQIRRGGPYGERRARTAEGLFLAQNRYLLPLANAEQQGYVKGGDVDQKAVDKVVQDLRETRTRYEWKRFEEKTRDPATG